MIGRTISNYKILEELGHGGMGIVYKAEDTKLKRTVALKFLPPHLTLDQESKERFIREAQAASALDHNNICTIHEINQTEEGQLFMVMACYEGQTLKVKIKNDTLTIEDAVNIITQVAQGLSKAHEIGIIHRDIKPANIMVTDDGVAKILDFGLAKLTDRSMITKEGSTLGTVSYMSPEQIRGETSDHRADIWALGVVFYEMLTGQTPFTGEYEQAIMYSILSENFERPSTINPDIPIEMDQIIQKALQKNPAKRYQSTNELIADFNYYLNEQAIKNIPFHFKTIIKNPKIIVPAVFVLIAIIFLIYWLINRNAKIRWAIEEALPQIEEMVEGTYLAGLAPAYELELQAQKYIPANSQLLDLISKSTVISAINSDPPGAKVYLKEYNKPETEWQFIGVTPVDSIRMARDFFRFKFEKQGFQTVNAVDLTFILGAKGWIPVPIHRILTPDSIIPNDMVRVPGTETEFGQVPDFFVDKFEITNKQFKIFVDDNGYINPKYWKYPFIKDDKELKLEEALNLFKDATGRPGPAVWEAGDYPEGQENYPVTGICWYEAAAYADYMGKELPTITHWRLAAGLNKIIGKNLLPSYLYPLSNFKNAGAEPVGYNKGITFYGAYDMAGNVREWCFNDIQPGIRSLCGGAWNDAPYQAGNITQASAFDRSSMTGFRCALCPDTTAIPPEVYKTWTGYSGFWNYKNIQRVSDEIFQLYKDQFSYTKDPLNAQIDVIDSTHQDWIVEKISYNTAYNNERMNANLYIPRNISKPFQTVIYFPGSSAIYYPSVDSEVNWYQFQLTDFIIKNGRAVIIPAYKGTYGRNVDDAYNIHEGKPSRRYVEYLIQVIKDFRRTIDYLESRPDIDSNKIAYLGLSWGGLWAPMITSVEDRLKVSILALAGLRSEGINDIHPAGDPLNYVAHVNIPTLILSGKYDVIFPYNTVVKPMYDLLGTPVKDKKNIIYETDHYIPRNELIRETLEWLDKYLGPVK